MIDRWRVFIEEIKSVVDEDRILYSVPMKEQTSIRVGGAAKMLILPSCRKEIAEIIKMLYRMKIPYYVVGNGTNLIVSDEGYPGVIIRLAENYSDIKVDGSEITALSGASLAAVSNIAMLNSLTGLEFASGIPGTIGGAVAMNAGAYNCEMKDVVAETSCIDEQGNLLLLKGAEHDFGYRSSRIQKEKLIVVEVRVRLQRGNISDIKEKMRYFNECRREKQPLDLPSAGSVFKRPPGYYAGRLIEDAGLKGYRIGGAKISEKHCGFIVNTGNATANDVIKLIEYVKERVFQHSGVMLEHEVKILGG
ncbi:MAG TPA: UDP-N-acetylenolpyruvoylglucosamine reductase [Ruminiclostridium sp.]|jgi:UDP-N-acetylmuramate dehydrogenase|nr:UDP-N-acetylmuramate dehydrogenase [Clostridiaceae bacterium]HAA24525.1 UDP-N-acetylenolpyruvoylglucosamine reductase [Ruminiclostridium sp.]